MYKNICIFIVSQLKSTYNDESCCRSFKSCWLLPLSCNYAFTISHTRHLSWQLANSIHIRLTPHTHRTVSHTCRSCACSQNYYQQQLHNSIPNRKYSPNSASPLIPSRMCTFAFLFSSWIKLQSHAYQSYEDCIDSRHNDLNWMGWPRTRNDGVWTFVCIMFRWMLQSSSPACKNLHINRFHLV